MQAGGQADGEYYSNTWPFNNQYWPVAPGRDPFVLVGHGLVSQGAHETSWAFFFCLFRRPTDQVGSALEPPPDPLVESSAEGIVPSSGVVMDYRVSYEHSLKNKPVEFIVHVPSQLVDDIPANVPRALLPQYITDLILKRSPQIGKIRHLRIL